MHHSLRFYSRHRESFLRYYIFQAKWTHLPLLGGMVRAIAGAYGKSCHGAYLLTPDQAREIIDLSTTLSLGPCSCRKVFKKCDNPLNTEILVGTGADIFASDRPGDYSRISRQEAREVIMECHKRHLLHTLVKCRGDFYALCNCCPCCCVPLRLRKNYRIGSALRKVENIVELFRNDI